MNEKSRTAKQFSLAELIDIPAFQNLAESFTSLTGMGTAILDTEGTVLVGSGWQQLCTNFHRKHPATLKRCQESDTILASQLKQGQLHNIYKCKNGLIDVAVPIIIDGMHIGNVFTGQFFFEPPDIDFFIRQAEEFEFDKKEYLASVNNVPVLSREKVEQAMGFLSNVTTIIGKSGLDRKLLLELNTTLENRVEQRTKEIQAEKTFSESLVNSLPAIMYVFDRLGRFKKWNKNFEIVTGYSADELGELSPLDLFATRNDKRRIIRTIDKVFRTGSANVEASFATKEGQEIPHLFTGYKFIEDNIPYLVGVGIDISERVAIETEKEELIARLQATLSEIKQLSGFLPICASCKKIRDDAGYWNQIESYIRDHSEAQFSHAICPECAEKIYADLQKYKDNSST